MVGWPAGSVSVVSSGRGGWNMRKECLNTYIDLGNPIRDDSNCLRWKCLSCSRLEVCDRWRGVCRYGLSDDLRDSNRLKSTIGCNVRSKRDGRYLSDSGLLI